jgi:hypothetical protein
MVDIDALRVELKQPAYADLSDAAAAELVRQVAVAITRPIPAAEVKKLWGRRMILARCEIAAGNTTLPDAVRVVCRATYDNLMGDLFTDLDPTDATQSDEITAYLGALVQAQMMTEQDRTDTLALAQTEHRPFAGVTSHDVWLARGQPER